MVKPKLEFVFEIRVKLGERMHTGPVPRGGGCAFVPVIGGEIEGPRLNGTVVPYSGGDWPHIRPDGVVAFDAHYMLQAMDGSLIYIKNRGYRHGPAEVIERILAKEEVDPSEYYMRLAPVFETPIGPHDWLSRTILVGTGNRRPEHSVFRYWALL